MDKRIFRLEKGAKFLSDKAYGNAKRKIMEAAAHIGMFFAGFILSFATIFEGARPIALAFASATVKSKYCAATMAGAFVGYAFATGGIEYCASLLVCAACATLLTRYKTPSQEIIMPICVFVSLLFVGCAELFVSFNVRDLIFLLCEVTIGASLTYFFSLGLSPATPGTRQSKMYLAGILSILLAFLLALEPVHLFGEISPSRIISMMCVMASSFCGGSAVGAACGVTFGAAFDLTGGMQPYFAGIYGFAGLFSGMSRGESRLSFSICYVLANFVASLWGMGSGGASTVLYECLIASVLFTALPDKAFTFFRAIFAQSAEKEQPTVESRVAKNASNKIARARTAIEALGHSLGDFSFSQAKQNEEDISRIFHRASDKVCRNCPVSAACWDRDYVSTFGALNDVTATLRKKHKLEPSDYPSYFSSRCINIIAFNGAVNDEYTALIKQKTLSTRARENRLLVKKQYDGVSGVLLEMENECGKQPETFPSLEARAERIAAAYFHRPRAALYTQGERMVVDIHLTAANAIPTDYDAFIKSLSLSLNRNFSYPEDVPTQRGTLLRVIQKDRFSAAVDFAGCKKDGEIVSGDSYMQLKTDDGRMIVMISDGMGSGEAASKMSRETLDFIARFAKAGCSLSESARAVIPVLEARLTQCGFVTLDLLEINLITGRCKITKYGAAQSYLFYGGKSRTFLSQALPAGLDEGNSIATEEFDLPGTCTFMMMSDGVADAVDAKWIIQHSKQSANPSVLAKDAVDFARTQAERSPDDMTALIISISRDYE